MFSTCMLVTWESLSTSCMGRDGGGKVGGRDAGRESWQLEGPAPIAQKGSVKLSYTVFSSGNQEVCANTESTSAAVAEASQGAWKRGEDTHLREHEERPMVGLRVP